ncbi:nitroreductase family protein [Acetohalobium arabaticum]|uniref:Nitroreductase n=1 Tax=Acetohalobium arabaticum (strain ATCC 49924 / DSM 5501 / Z-7288) TaxID=574087 RepID=D9QVT9_ACEAZ|nr:nitroreductase family protein [Acetohalobium arabaticum]ADL12348.1 nitroreductase [Acetohalobium arabaticum DSM 5501]
MLSLLKKRRSIRKYQNREVENEKVEKLIKAALLSPSSRGFEPWEFIVVDDKESLNQLADAKEAGSAFLDGAPVGIVVCADPEVSDVWIEDTSIASINIQLAAEDLGLGSCWIQIRNRNHSAEKTSSEYVKEVLSIPDNLEVESIIAIGYADEEKPPHKEDDLNYQKIFRNSYGSSSY